MQGKPAHAIAGSDFLWKPIMHRTHSSNCHTHRTLPGLPACLTALTLLPSASVDLTIMVFVEYRGTAQPERWQIRWL